MEKLAVPEEEEGAFLCKRFLEGGVVKDVAFNL